MDEEEGLKKPSVMDQRWACLTCFWSGRFGQLMSYGKYVGCPKCKSADIHPAHAMENPAEYVGTIGTRN